MRGFLLRSIVTAQEPVPTFFLVVLFLDARVFATPAEVLFAAVLRPATFLEAFFDAFLALLAAARGLRFAAEDFFFAARAGGFSTVPETLEKV